MNASTFAARVVASTGADCEDARREGRLIRPTAKYIGHGPRTVAEVE